MKASIQGSLNQFENNWMFFEHKGKQMSKAEVRAVLEFGLEQGYKSTGELQDEDVDRIISKVNNRLAS